MSTFNSRGVHFSTIKFFERTLLVHDKVQDVRFEDIFFRITLYDSRVVNLIVNEYIHGMAAVCEALEEFPSAFVVNCGNWNSYTGCERVHVSGCIGKPDFGDRKIPILPNRSKVFVFGSILNSECPRDFDILIIYDSNLVPANKAYIDHRKFLSFLRKKIDLPIDLILLTYEEERKRISSTDLRIPMTENLIRVLDNF